MPFAVVCQLALTLRGPVALAKADQLSTNIRYLSVFSCLPGFLIRFFSVFRRDPIFFPSGYSSLLGQCLRLVSYATGALPHLRLRAFHGRSSLPSLCYRIAGDSVAAL